MSDTTTPLLRILIFDDDTERANMLVQALEASEYTVEIHTASVRDLLPQVEAIKPDVILIGADVLGQNILADIATTKQQQSVPIVIFTKDNRSETIRAATQAGASAYVVNGLSPERIQPIIEAAIARFREFQALAQELKKTKTNLAERKIIERAKGLVMEQRGCTEAKAYRMLQKTAMDQKKRLAEIAQDILSVTEVLKNG